VTPFVSGQRQQASRRLPLRVRCDEVSSSAAAAPASTPVAVADLYKELDLSLDDYRRAPASVVSDARGTGALPGAARTAPEPAAENSAAAWRHRRLTSHPAHPALPTQKQEVTGDVLATVRKLADAGALTKWGAALADFPQRRSTMLGELRLVGIKQPEKIAQVSVRNDAAFLFSVVGSTSVIAMVLGQLPGDWGFFGSYLTGGQRCAAAPGCACAGWFVHHGLLCRLQCLPARPSCLQAASRWWCWLWGPSTRASCSLR
jgi:hypothetical protein